MNTSEEAALLGHLEGHSSEGEVGMSSEERAYLRLSQKHGVSPEELESYLEHMSAHRQLPRSVDHVDS